jgi:hypothetical protein
MPWRMRYLTTRDHPLAYGLYAATFLLGLTLLTGYVDTVSLHGFDQVMAILWKLQMLTGGLAALWAIWQKPKMTPHWPDLGDLLRVEAIAAGQGACGYMVYTWSLILLQNRLSIPALVLGVVGLGLFARCIQAYKESEQAERLALLYDEVQHTLGDLERSHSVALPGILRQSAEEVIVTPDEDKRDRE